MAKKKAVDLSGLPEGRRSDLQNSKAYKKQAFGRGIGGGKLIEPLPDFVSTGAEKVIQGQNNAWIVLGRDRPSNRLSGYGGRGHTQAGSIDIVVGRMGHQAKDVGEDGREIFVDPNFSTDAARIHISQKTDIDRNFQLADGRVGDAVTRSAIGLKADHIRLVSREGIKLVTKADTHNSQGGEVLSVYGIDLIAGNDDSDLQPLLKGDNTAEAIETLTQQVQDLTSIVETFLASQMKYNAVLAAHTHITPVGPSAPSIEAAASGISTLLQQSMQSLLNLPLHRTNVEVFKVKYLSPVGNRYIKSRHNNTN